MRIVIAGPPKTGNVWLKCLLAATYGLRVIPSHSVSKQPDIVLLKRWIEQGRFDDGTIFHQHHDYSVELCDLIEAVPARIITIIRDPYDVWVSSFFTLQREATDNTRPGRRRSRRVALMGKPIDHPDVLRQLRRGGYRKNLQKANEWLHSGRSTVVRYEALKRDELGELKHLTDQIAPVEVERLEYATETCSAENMRRMSASLAKHVRKATVGDSRNHLTEAHLAIFRERYGDLIRSLGYEVR